MKRKTVEAWALVFNRDGMIIAMGQDTADFGYVAPDERIVRLVEHDPRAAGVVRAAVAMCTRSDWYGKRMAALCRAVARMRKGR